MAEKTKEEIFLNELKDWINIGMNRNDLKTCINQRLKLIESEGKGDPANLKNANCAIFDVSGSLPTDSDIVLKAQEQSKITKKHFDGTIYKDFLTPFISGAIWMREKVSSIPDVSNQRGLLIAFQKWCYEHPEYDQVCESSKIDIYLKSN